MSFDQFSSHPSLGFFSFFCFFSFSYICSSINIFFFVSDKKKNILCQNIHRYFSIYPNISIKLGYQYIHQNRYLHSCFPQTHSTSLSCIHRLSYSRANSHKHSPSKAQLKTSNLLMPKPPNLLSLQSVDQLTKCILLPSDRLFHKKSL